MKDKDTKISKKMVASYFKVISKESENRTGYLSKDMSRPLYQLAMNTAKQNRSYMHNVKLR